MRCRRVIVRVRVVFVLIACYGKGVGLVFFLRFLTSGGLYIPHNPKPGFEKE